MTQPHNPHAEQAVIGAALLAPQWIPTLAALLDPTALYNPHHHTIWTTITNLQPLGPVDPITIARALQLAGQLERIGGIDYLHTCAAACPTPANAPVYITEIHDHHTSRQLQHLSAQLAQAATQPGTDRTLLLEQATTVLHHIRNNTRATNGHHLDIIPAHTYRITPVKWTWEERIPQGEITLIPGRENTGKSTWLAWLAAQITTGNLPGMWHGKPRSVLYAANEDSWNHTITPRMLAAGADLNRIYHLVTVTPQGEHTRLRLPRDLHDLPRIAEHADAAVLMLDPLLSAIGDDINTYKAQELRTALEPLRAAAEAADIAIVGLAHFNKGDTGDLSTRVAGSRAFVEVARAVLAIASDDDADTYTCVISQIKNNLGRTQLADLAFTIDDVTLETDEGIDAHIGRARMIGEYDVSAGDLITGQPHERGMSDNTMAVVGYIEANGDEPLTTKDIIDAFTGKLTPAAVRQILSRSLRRGVIMSPSRGKYTSTKKGVKRAPKARSYRTPPTPSVTMEHMSLQQRSSSLRVSQEREDLVTSVTDDESASCDVVTPGNLRAHTRAADVLPSSDHELNFVEPIPLKSCKICHGPFEDLDGTGQHTTCPPNYIPPPAPELPPAAPDEDDDEPEDWWKR